MSSPALAQAIANMYAGIDVDAEELVLVLRKGGAAEAAMIFRNTTADRARLTRKLAKLPRVNIYGAAAPSRSAEGYGLANDDLFEGLPAIILQRAASRIGNRQSHEDQ